ncbi:ABC transporter permease [Paenibacillus filicis]|uniref:ABC transporter permease n=1 Tax=Paenibacillus filicis TaxID=669464 RepID=A0ABU9DRR6_9BACL
MSQSVTETNGGAVLSEGKKRTKPLSESKLKGAASSFLTPLIAFVAFFCLWEMIIRIFKIKMVILPAPSGIFTELLRNFSFYLPHIWTTFTEAISGFFIGALIALIAGILLSQSRLLERVLLPLAVLAHVTPIVAIAPLFIVWFGFGAFPKILLAAISTFFPMMINSIMGFRSIDENNYEYLQSLHASKFEIFIKLRLPNSLPYLFSAARTGMSMGVIGAIVGEMYGGSEGLGNVLTVAANYLQMERMFAAIMLLALIGILLTNAVKVVENRFLHWHSSSK